MIEFLLAASATLLTVVSLIMAGVFLYTYGRTGESLCIYLVLGHVGIACASVTLAITRWEFGYPCIPPGMMLVRFVGVVICACLTTWSGWKIYRLMRMAPVKQ